jgi:hypothetical protein
MVLGPAGREPELSRLAVDHYATAFDPQPLDYVDGKEGC